jgi:hypothetical protein
MGLGGRAAPCDRQNNPPAIATSIATICFGEFCRPIEVESCSKEDLAIQLPEGWILGSSPDGKNSTVRDPTERIGLTFTEPIPEEHLDCVALVKAVAAAIGVEIAAPFECIELRVGDAD